MTGAVCLAACWCLEKREKQTPEQERDVRTLLQYQTEEEKVACQSIDF